jgi:hypothetical protein
VAREIQIEVLGWTSWSASYTVEGNLPCFFFSAVLTVDLLAGAL